jgi:hypothetical protein
MRSSRAMRVLLGLLGFVSLLVTALPANAQWKWKDPSGQIHVSDLPPPREIADKDVLQRPVISVKRPAASASAPASAAGQRSRVDPELEARRAKAEHEQKANARAEEDKLAGLRAENCQRARQHLAALESGQRIARVNSKGEREVLDDKGRADEMMQARQVIGSDCR